MRGITVCLNPIHYRLVNETWLGDLSPYEYQWHALNRMKQALDDGEFLCLFLNAPTGSGKTLAAYAVSILRGVPALGVYPTNELIKDQERALRPWLDGQNGYRLVRIDSRELDRWTVPLAKQSHATTLETLLNWNPTVLTNPDILFYVFFGLYGGWDKELDAIRQRLFARIGQYRVFVFDEFHLYNVKQVADAAFFIGTLHEIQPDYGRVFLFASATPDSPIRKLLERMGLPVEAVTGEPVPEGEGTRRVAQPLRLTLLPADMHAWKGSEKLLDFLPEVEGFLRKYPTARLVIILDSVAEAMRLAHALRKRFPDRPVGEVHGFSSPQERDEALLKPITVGTSTIEVGVDFAGERTKDVLLFEARTSSQFIQRLGRIARHAKPSSIPDWAVALVPEYVYHFLAERLQEGEHYDRWDLYRWIEEAYQVPEDFGRYLQRHAPAEFCAARARVIGKLFTSESAPKIREALDRLGETLTGMPNERAWALYCRYKKEGLLAPLLTFRGSGLEVAIVDERGTDPGFPLKRYDLVFLLRRGVFLELSPDEYRKILDSLENRWPEEAALERRYARLIGANPEDLLGVYGYFRLTGWLDEPRQVWFELPVEAVRGRVGKVSVLEGLEVQTEPSVSLRLLNRRLRHKRIVSWVGNIHPTALRLGRSLPPLFEVYELRIRGLGGQLRRSSWSIAFNQNAFFLESLEERGESGEFQEDPGR